MRGNFAIPAASARVKSRALGSTALTVLAVMATQAAWAASPTPPAAGSLPGTFYASAAGVTYAGAGTLAAITVVGNQANALQWGGTAPGTFTKVTAPSSIATNSGFSIGSGAGLGIQQSVVGPTPVLISDQTGNPSQIYGTLTTQAPVAPAVALTGPLYVSNTNGVIVGTTGVITAPTNGVGLLGYAVDAATFAGTVTVNNATAGGGAVTVANGASISNGPLLVASNGTVNIGADATGGPLNYVLAGWGFTTTGGPPASVVPTIGTVRSDGASSVVNFTAPATMTVDELYAGGAVNNATTLTISTAIAPNLSVAGLFTNTGTLNETADLGANQLAGGLANLGTINEQAAAGLTILSTNGNVQSTGVLNLTGTGLLEVEGANVDLEGAVQIAGTALSTTNHLTALNLSTTAMPAQSAGVVDIATSLFTNGSAGPAVIQGNAIRVLSGGIFASAGNVLLGPGTDAAAVADPFYSLKSLGYTFSLFPGTQVSDAGQTITVANPAGGTSFSNASGLNLDGQLSAPTINVVANNIHSNNGLAGGFSVPNGGVINLQFFGNVNNPAGAAANGSTSFLYNYVPVTVGANGTKPGTAEIELAGPSYSSATEQFVNLLVQGNVNLADGSGSITIPTMPAVTLTTTPLTAPGPFPTAPISPYANNHLVVTATGNIGLISILVDDLASPDIFYWPGLVYLTSGATASNPTAAPSSTASISLGTSATFVPLVDAPLVSPTNVNLSNIIPADLTKPSVGGQIGGGGVYFLTNNLILSPGGGATSTVTISNDSWANFLTAAIASAFAITSPSQFLGGYIQSNGQVNTQQLPAADFQP